MTMESPILYLDYDGVLHHEDVRISHRHGPFIAAPGYQLFQHVDVLVRILEPFPKVRIVLSTSWV